MQRDAYDVRRARPPFLPADRRHQVQREEIRMFPGNRPASVTVDPEVEFTGPEKQVFPGSRASAGADPLRDGDASARKTTALPFGLPFGTTVTSLPEDAPGGNSAQTRNAAFGGEHGESGVAGTGASNQGAADPDHNFSQDGGASRFYQDPDALPTSLQGVDTAEHEGVSGEKEAPYVPTAGTLDPEHG